MKRISILVAAVTLLGAAPASAKEVTAVALCGAEGCSDVAVPQGLHEFPGGGAGSTLPPPAGPFLEVVLTFDRVHEARLWYVPAARLFAIRDDTGSARWLPVGSHRLDRLIAAAAADVTPYRPRVTEAFVESEQVAGDVSSYLGLFAVASAGPAGDRGSEFASVSLTTEPPSPWAQTRLWFYPESGVLERGAETILLPDSIADDVAAARSIDPDTGGATAGFDWPLVTGSLLVALGLALTALLLSRRGRQPRTA